MAKPDTDDGWLKMAHELFAALAVADFTLGEWIVIREVLNQVYGPSKSRYASLSPTDIATRAGTHKPSVCRAISDLVAGNTLARSDHGYRFLKDYESWKRADGTPRMSAQRVAYCKAAKPSIASKRDGRQSANDLLANRLTQGSQPANAALANQLTTGSQPANGPHYIERARSEKFENKENRTGAGESVHTIQPRPADPPFPDIEDADLNRRSAAVRMILDAATEAFGERGERWAGRYACEHTEHVPAVLAAIRDGRVLERSGQSIKSVGGFILSKLNNPRGGGASAAVADPPKPRCTPEQSREHQARLAASIRPAPGYRKTGGN